MKLTYFSTILMKCLTLPMFAQNSYAHKTNFLAQKQEFFPISWSLLTPYSSGNTKNELCGPKIIELGPEVTYGKFSN